MKASLCKIEISNIGTVILSVPDSQYLARELPADSFHEADSLSINGWGIQRGVVRMAAISNGEVAVEQPSLFGVAIVQTISQQVVSFNGKDYKVEDIPRPDSPDVRLTARYAAAWLEGHQGYWEAAFKILARSVRDKYLVDVASTAFLLEERSAVVDMIAECVANPSLRFKDGQSGPNYIPGKDTPCVLNLVEMLRDFGAVMHPYHELAESYRRISATSFDPKTIFIPDYRVDNAAFVDNEGLNKVTAKFENVVLTNGLFNISVRSRIPGIVNLNPRAADRVNLPKQLKTFEHRRFTLVEDGKVNVKKIVVHLRTGDQFNQLRSAGYSVKPIRNLKESQPDYGLVEITVPRHIFNYSHTPESNPDLFSGKVMADHYRNELSASSRKYVIRQLLAERPVTEVAKAYAIARADEGSRINHNDQRENSIRYERRSLDQIRVLQDHGINMSGNYIGIDRQLEAPSEELLEKQVRTYSLQIPGFSTFPELKKVLTKVKLIADTGKGTMTKAQQMIADTHARWKDAPTQALVQRLLDDNRIIQSSRLQIWKTMTLVNLLGYHLDGVLRVESTGDSYVFSSNGTRVNIKNKLVSPVSKTASYA